MTSSLNKKIVMFWLPLLATWVFMGLEHPISSGLVARLGDSKEQLAAFGVAFAFGLIIESPIINILSAVAALCKNRGSYLVCIKSSYTLVLFVVLTHLFVLTPPAFDFIMKDAIGLSDSIAYKTYDALIFIILWPPMIGIRRFYQGIMVANGETKKIAYATFCRLCCVLSLSFYFVNYSDFPGASAGAFTLSLAVTVEAVFVYLASLSSQKYFLSKFENEQEAYSLTYRQFSSYYFPLVQTSFLGLAFQPMLTFFIARSVNALEALAAFPVANGFAFMFRTIGLSITEVYLVFFQKGKEYVCALVKITGNLILISSLLYAAITFTPLADIIFQKVLGIKGTIAERVSLAAKFYLPIVSGTILLSFFRAKIMTWSRTRYLSRGTLVEVLSATIIVWLLIDYYNVGGAISAAIAICISRYAQIAYLVLVLKKNSMTIFKA